MPGDRRLAGGGAVVRGWAGSWLRGSRSGLLVLALLAGVGSGLGAVALAGDAGRAQGESRLRADPHLVGALHRRRRVPCRHRRLPGARGRGGRGLRARSAGARALPRAPRVKTITWLSPHDAPEWFPPAEQALDEPAGLLAAGGDLSPERLIAAYRRGIFPWYSPGQPVLWWSPDPRAVLFPEEFRLHAQPGEDAAQWRLQRLPRSRLRRRHRRVRGAAHRQPRHLDHRRDARRLPRRCTASAARTASRSGAAVHWSADCTGCAWAGCSSANRCSAASATPRRRRSRTWWRCAGATSSPLSIASCRRDTWRASAPAPSRAASSRGCCASTRAAPARRCCRRRSAARKRARQIARAARLCSNSRPASRLGRYVQRRCDPDGR